MMMNEMVIDGRESQTATVASTRTRFKHKMPKKKMRIDLWFKKEHRKKTKNKKNTCLQPWVPVLTMGKPGGFRPGDGRAGGVKTITSKSKH